MIGYDSIPPVPPLVRCAPSYDPPEREFLRTVGRTMAAQGFTEVSNYSFVSEEEARRFGFAVEDHVRVLNPIAAGQELLRTSLLPGIHRNIVENARHFDQFRIFEIGREIHKQNETKPDERPHLMAALYAKDDGRAGLLELKRTAECLAPGLQVRPPRERLGAHGALCRSLVAGPGGGKDERTASEAGGGGTRRRAGSGFDDSPGVGRGTAEVQARPPFPDERLRFSIVTGVRALAAIWSWRFAGTRANDGIGGVRTRVSGRAFAGRPQERFVPRGGGRGEDALVGGNRGHSQGIIEGLTGLGTSCGFDGAATIRRE